MDKMRLEWFAEPPLCIFISSQLLDATSSSVLQDPRSDRECRDEQESGENITSSLDKLGWLIRESRCGQEIWEAGPSSGAEPDVTRTGVGNSKNLEGTWAARDELLE